jgi:hypothetical protein
MTESKSPVIYEPSTDTMAIEIRPWPGGEGEGYGGKDAGPDLVIHYTPDGEPWMWEIENASTHPEHIVAALTELRHLSAHTQQQLHTIKFVKPSDAARLYLGFDDDGTADQVLVDLSPLLAQGGVFEPLRDPAIFQRMKIGPNGRALVWHVGDDVVDLGADALWLMAHPDQATPGVSG